MDKKEGYEVEIEYSSKDLMECLKNMLEALIENCEKNETKIENTPSIR